jgi:hypothetical protein
LALHGVYSSVGTGPPVILVHGVGARRQSWDDVVAHLKADFTCIA